MWFKVNVHGNEAKAIVPIAKLREILESHHGSGIDGDFTIDIAKNGNITVSFDFHRMDEDGSYCGWIRPSFRIYRAREEKLHPLSGPCAGQFQTLHRKGDILMGPIRGCGRSFRGFYSEGIRESLGDEFHDALTTGGILTKGAMA